MKACTRASAYRRRRMAEAWSATASASTWKSAHNLVITPSINAELGVDVSRAATGQPWNAVGIPNITRGE